MSARPSTDFAPASTSRQDPARAAPAGRAAGGCCELSATGPAASALQRHFELHPAAFAALHAIGGAPVRRFASAVVASSQLATHTLTIRRDGIGATLATIGFVELPAAGGAPERLYATEAECGDASRLPIAETLLAFSRLAVVVVGVVADGAATDAQSEWAALHERLRQMPWPNRQLLVLPLAEQPVDGSDLSARVARLVAGTSVSAVTTPRLAAPQAAWAHIDAAWRAVRAGRPLPSAPRAGAPAPAPAACAPSAMRSGRRRGAEDFDPARLLRYAQACAALRGASDICVFRIVDRRLLAHAGRASDPQLLAAQGAALLASALGAASALGGRQAVVENRLVLDTRILLARMIPGQRGLGLLAVYDRTGADPDRISDQLRRLEALLEPHREAVRA